ncbi:hypothetical protein JCM5353_003310 [Sporobolomyces roseus]
MNRGRRDCALAACTREKPHTAHPVTSLPPIPPTNTDSHPSNAANRTSQRQRGKNAPAPSLFPSNASTSADPSDEHIDPLLLDNGANGNALIGSNARIEQPVASGSTTFNNPAPSVPSLFGDVSRSPSPLPAPVFEGTIPNASLLRQSPAAPTPVDIPVERRLAAPLLQAPTQSKKANGNGKGKERENNVNSRKRQASTTPSSQDEGGGGGEDGASDDERLGKKKSRDKKRAEIRKNASLETDARKQRSRYQAQVKSLLHKVELLDIENASVGLLLMSHPRVHGANGRTTIPFYKSAYSDAVVDDTKIVEFSRFTFPRSAIPFQLPDDANTRYSNAAIYKTITSLFKLIVQEEQLGIARTGTGAIGDMQDKIQEMQEAARVKDEEDERKEQLRIETEREKKVKQREELRALGMDEDAIERIINL